MPPAPSSPSAPRASPAGGLLLGSPATLGISFPVSELLMVRDWAARHGMIMQIVTDHVLNGAAFEELLLLRNAATCERLLCLWRRSEEVVAQRPSTRPQGFRSLDAALAALTPVPARNRGIPITTRANAWSWLRRTARRLRAMLG